MLRKACVGYLATVIETQSEEIRLEDISIVREFPDVFPYDLLGMPSNRKVEFSIDLVHGAGPISMAP